MGHGVGELAGEVDGDAVDTPHEIQLTQPPGFPAQHYESEFRVSLTWKRRLETRRETLGLKSTNFLHPTSFVPHDERHKRRGHLGK